MKLFTKEIDKKLFEQYPKGGSLENQMVVAKIFNPYGRGTWYIINSDPEDPDYLWAIVDLFEVEVGSVNRSDLENAKVKPFMLGFERDTSFKPVNASELYNGLLDGKRYADGGSIGDENKDMVMNNNVQIMHHAKELSEAVKNAKQIPAWVVAKVYDATQTLSDVTHYLDGENKMAKGGDVVGYVVGDIVTFEGAQYKIGSFDVVSPKTTLVYLNDLNNNPAEDYRGNYLKVNISNINKKYAEGSIIEGGENKMAKGGGVIDKYRDELEAMDDLELANVVYDKLGFSREETLEQLQQNEAYRDDLIDSILDSYSSSLRNRGEKFATGGGVEFDKDEIEKSAVFYTDESRWSTKPSISEFESKIKNDKESLSKLENKEITPSKIVGGGYKSSAAAKKVAKEYLEKRILVNQRAIEILKSRGEKYADGGGVENDVWEKYQIQDKHGYVSYFDDKDMALKFLKENEGSFAIRWNDEELPIMATGGGIKGEVEVGTILYANTGVPVKVLQYDSKFGGRVLIERADGINTGAKPSWMPLSKFTKKMQNGGDVSATEIAKMKKINVKGFEAYMPSVSVVYYDTANNKYYFKDYEGDFMELRNENTLQNLRLFLDKKTTPKMAEGGNLPYTYSLIRRWSDNMVTDADIDSVIQAMIKAKITDADLVTPPTKTGTQFTKAKEKLNNEIFKKIQEVYVGNLKGNQPYGIIATMVDRATRFDDKTIAEYKKQNMPTKSGWKHKKTTKA